MLNQLFKYAGNTTRLLEFLEPKCILRRKYLAESIKFDNGATYGFQFNLIAVTAKIAIAIIEIPTSHLTWERRFLISWLRFSVGGIGYG